ncbi:DNA alkylation repair protein [Puniceibacterium sp. IMCC21224]|uniref:DNA alkylation repair protein n=1 Tax=Puniceibacterium sp. IMCC21224 TaxID=1618204 RepID=UPI00064DE5C4|nr:DNA alkylation repair protein [Puniceibacterium sp. IMCC21224]KMK67049.1 putative DNA alkylation repair enzyme [Puniceibacterium sp. IMCC21224]
MTLDDALAALRAQAEPGRAEQMAAYHKTPRAYLGVPNPAINAMSQDWRQTLDLDQRVSLAQALWDSDIFEARLTAAKLLTQARIRPDDRPVWDLFQSWVPDFDSWAIADHACMAGQRRLTADPVRLDVIESWTQSPHMWTRRAALVITLPWTKQNFPSQQELAARDRILGWAATYIEDSTWFIQKAIAWWLRDLSKHDPERTRSFLASHGADMKPFARREAARYLEQP